MKKSLRKMIMLATGLMAVNASLVHLVVAQDDSSEESAQSESVAEEASSESNEADQQAEASDLQMSLDLALQLFDEQVAGVEITDIDIDLNRDEGYDINLQGIVDGDEYEYDARFVNNELENDSLEQENDDDDNDEVLDLENYLSIDEITEIAMDEIGTGQVTDWTLDFDNGVPEWELSFDDTDDNDDDHNDDNDDDDIDITIHAETGEILQRDDANSVDNDGRDDDDDDRDDDADDNDDDDDRDDD